MNLTERLESLRPKIEEPDLRDKIAYDMAVLRCIEVINEYKTEAMKICAHCKHIGFNTVLMLWKCRLSKLPTSTNDTCKHWKDNEAKNNTSHENTD